MRPVQWTRSRHRQIEAWVVAMSWSIERTKIFCTSDPWAERSAQQQFLWEVIALLLPSRRKPTDADSRRARENSVPLSIQAQRSPYVRGTRRQGGESVPEPLRAAISAIPARRRPTTEDFEKASVQGSSAVR